MNYDYCVYDNKNEIFGYIAILFWTWKKIVLENHRFVEKLQMKLHYSSARLDCTSIRSQPSPPPRGLRVRGWKGVWSFLQVCWGQWDEISISAIFSTSKFLPFQPNNLWHYFDGENVFFLNIRKWHRKRLKLSLGNKNWRWRHLIGPIQLFKHIAL